MNPDPSRPLTRDEGLAVLTGTNSPMTVSKAVIRDVEYDVFTHAPNDMRDHFTFSYKHFKDLEFIIYQDERVTFGEVHRKAVGLSKSLINLGVKPGDRVAIAMRNFPEYVIAVESILGAGAVVVTLNAWWIEEEIEYGITDSGCRFAFVDQERWDRFLPSKHLLDLGIAITRPDGDIPDGALSMDELMAGDAGVDFPDLQIDTDSDAIIMYTSGSTAHPKGVVLTHRGIVTALMIFNCIGLLGSLTGKDDAVRLEVYNWLNGGAAAMEDPLAQRMPREQQLVNVPFFHVSGLHTMLFLSYRVGRKLVLMYKWNVEKALELVEKEKLTKVEGVPTMVGEIIHCPKLKMRDLSSLVSISGGGAARPPEHVKLIRERIPHVVPGIGYGMTETNAAGNTIGGEEYEERPTSVGRPSPPILLQEIRDENDNALPPLEVGEICIKAALNMRCYWNKPEDTDGCLKEGWLYSGDLGYLDEEGFLFITGRSKDMIIRGGENIACGEIENVLHEHAAVNEAAVHGAPHERLGEIVCAAIFLRTGCSATIEEIQEHVRSHLAAFKVPGHVHFATDRLPRIASGKFDKITLKKKAIERLEGLAAADG